MGEVVGEEKVEARNVSVNEIHDAGKQRQKICAGNKRRSKSFSHRPQTKSDQGKCPKR